MGAIEILASIFGPVKELIEHVIPNASDKVKAQTALFESQLTLANKMLEYESQLLEAQSRVITAEATGQSWIQRNWRPVTMLVFLFLVVMDSFGILPNRLSNEAWLLLQIGLGGYVAGRSIEKVLPKLKSEAKG